MECEKNRICRVNRRTKIGHEKFFFHGLLSLSYFSKNSCIFETFLIHYSYLSLSDFVNLQNPDNEMLISCHTNFFIP